MGLIRNCEKCDFNRMCLVKDTDNCPFDNPMTFVGEPVQPKEMSNGEAADILRKFLGGMQFPRGNGKNNTIIEALEKGE